MLSLEMPYRDTSRYTASSVVSCFSSSPGRIGNSHRWWPSGVGQSTAGRAGSQWKRSLSWSGQGLSIFVSMTTQRSSYVVPS